MRTFLALLNNVGNINLFVFTLNRLRDMVRVRLENDIGEADTNLLDYILIIIGSV